MAKFNKKNDNNRTANKPVNKILPLVVSGKDARGNDYDQNQAYDIVASLQEGDTFKLLSVNATMAKSICLGNADMKGSLNVARIKSYDITTGDVELLFLGKNTEYAKLVDGLVLVPRVRLNRDGNVDCILGFEIVPAMEA